MRYHFEKPATYSSMYGSTHICKHPIYNECTLFKIGDKGLAIVQQRFDNDAKRTWWGCIDPWLNDSLYLHPGFRDFSMNGQVRVWMDCIRPLQSDK